MNRIVLETRHLNHFIEKGELEAFQEELNEVYPLLMNRQGKGNDFLGWMDLPSTITEESLASIEREAQRLRSISEVILVIGIGGSYLGARALLETSKHPFSTLLEEREPEILYAGNHISQDYLHSLMDVLALREYSVIVISKSGTTTEPAIAFRLIKKHLEEKYGKKEARKRIVAITDKQRGALKNLAEEEGYPTYVIPDDVGGRYSVLTPVGLLPAAAGNFDIRGLIQGAREMERIVKGSADITANPAAQYAAIRNLLYRKGKTVEFMVSYLPSLYYLTEWWKQLYGESEGKQQQGILPHGVNFTTDLHSMGQYIQEGLRTLFETTLSVERTAKTMVIPADEANLDGLNYLAGKELQYVNRMAEMGTTLAHVDGGVPNMQIRIPEMTPYYLGQLIYFFEAGCALSGYLLDVNPFDQPGVEAYKKNMFALLGKPGFEEETLKIRKRLEQ
ncbi:MAG: glucose-6-phosphate isomerase [Bacteroidetes bacterium]|nr:MAG: glucose-6-phosphate isomerase [Bacteroidota bacterium]